MRYVVFLVLLGCVACSAATLIDPFNLPQNNCNESLGYPYSSCDVMGDPLLFDIQKADVSITGGVATVSLYFNTGGVTTDHNGNMTLGAFSVGSVSLIVGDLFFLRPDTVYDPADPNTTQYLKFGVPLMNHGSFVAGNLYKVGGAVTTETALQSLNDNSDLYRRNETVLMTGSGTAVGTGSGVTVTNNGNGTTTGALYKVTVSVPTSAADFLSIVVDNQVGILFSSADCGNDVIQSPVPEPPASVLLGAGLGLVLLGAWRRRARAPSGK